MHASAISSSLTLILGLLASSSLATIAYGHNSADEPIVWIYGESECRNVRIVDAGQWVCGQRFTLDNGYTFYFDGCGGPGLMLFNSDDSFNANCAWEVEDLECGVRQEWVC